jgi:signal peptidase I
MRRLNLISRELVTILVAIAVVVTARSSLADHYVVPSESMEPTVLPRDHIVVDKLAYGLRLPLVDGYAIRLDAPARGDVVVLHSPSDGIVLLKRIVAIPGDRVEVIDGKLELNGASIPVAVRDHELREYLGKHEHPVNLDSGGGPPFGPLVIPKDQFLVMGDNRGNSRDGRFFGLVSRESIFGRAEGVFLRNGAPTWIKL